MSMEDEGRSVHGTFSILQTPGRNDERRYTKSPGIGGRRSSYFLSWNKLSTLRNSLTKPMSKDAMKELDALLQAESECACVYDECEEAREMNAKQYASLKHRYDKYKEWIDAMEDQQDHPDWNIIQDIVQNQLPKILAHLQVKIDTNEARSRSIRMQLNSMREKRHRLQEKVIQTDEICDAPLSSQPTSAIA